MLKLVFNIRRRPEIEPEEFYRYWKDEHGPLVRSVADVLGIRRYVQSHTIDTPINDALRASRKASAGPGCAMPRWSCARPRTAAKRGSR